LFFFFFKQKTAYEFTYGDWSSDVCSSDLDVSYAQKMLLAGARGFVARSSAQAELLESLHQLWQMEAERAPQKPKERVEEAKPTKQGKIISVFSAKGGVGCTIIATNLAVAMRMQSRRSVVLFDADLRFGIAGVMLNLWADSTIGDLVRYSDELTHDLVDSVLVPHSSGIKVLLPPLNLEAAEEITSQQVMRILEIIRRGYDFIVVDMATSLDETTLALLDASFRIVFVTTPEVPALRNTRRMVELAQGLGYPREKIILVGNRFSATWGIRLREIGRAHV